MSEVGTPKSLKLVLVACTLTLAGLAISLVHFVAPSPLVFTLFVIFGQGAFLSGMGLYLVAIFLDLRSRKIL